MLRYMLDSNLCIFVMRRTASVVTTKLKQHHGATCVSTVTVHELVHGAEKSARPAYQMNLVHTLLSGLSVLDFDAAAASHSGEIHASLAKRGQIIGAYDMLIAGHARSLGLIVATNNMREFTRVDGLHCEDWLAEGQAS